MSEIGKMSPEAIRSFNKKDINKCIKNWAQLGFNNGLSEPQLTNVSIAFETMDSILLNSFTNQYQTEIGLLVFPIARRIFQKVDHEITIGVIVDNSITLIDELSKSYVESITEDFIAQSKKFNIDYEAEFCAVFSEKYKLNL